MLLQCFFWNNIEIVDQHKTDSATESGHVINTKSHAANLKEPEQETNDPDKQDDKKDQGINF